MPDADHHIDDALLNVINKSSTITTKNAVYGGGDFRINWCL